MPLHIERVETEIDLAGSEATSRASANGGRNGLAAHMSARDAELKERLRPLVLEILEEELERLRRQQG